MTPTDDDVPVDPADQDPQVTTSDESAADQTARIAEEDAGVSATNYTVQPNNVLLRDGVELMPGTTVQFRSDEVASGHVAYLVSKGVIA